MSEDRVRINRFLILTGSGILFSAFVFLLSLFWIQWGKEQEEKREFFRRASIQAESSLNLAQYEILHVNPGDRWSGNWSMNGNRFIYTDLDGTRYENLVEEEGGGIVVTAFSNYRGAKVRKSCRIGGARP